MAYQEGDTSPPHINVHNEVVTQVQDLADARNVDVILPPQRNIGDTEHVKDHNLITDAVAAVAAAGGGKVLQVVRAVDRTSLSTTSTSFVDAGVSVTITPTKATSHLMIVFTGLFTGGSDERDYIQITDTNDVPIDGINGVQIRGWASSRTAGYYQLTAIGYASPATTSPVTYKLMWKVDAGTTYLQGHRDTTQLWAIELEDVVVSP